MPIAISGVVIAGSVDRDTQGNGFIKGGITMQEEKINPLLILTKPKEIFEKAIAKGQDGMVIFLACLIGIAKTFDRTSMRNALDNINLSTLIIMALIIGPLAGIFTLYIGSYVFRLGVKILKGTSSPEKIRIISAYSAIPSLIGDVITYAIALPLFGLELFKSYTPRMEANPIMAGLLAVIGIAFMIWSFVLIVKGLKIANNFTTLKAMGSILIPILIFALGIGLIALIIIVIIGGR